MSSKKQSQPIDELEIERLGTVRAGRRVSHPVFAYGEVRENARWDGGDCTIRVEFESCGSKWLVPEFAKLMPA
jgi:hypothetical protein